MSEQQWVFIEPQDVWMFRDSRPFTAQQNFVARSHFPPHPGTMQGVIRSFYLERQGVNWGKYAQWDDDYAALYEAVGGPAYPKKDKSASMGALRISGPFVARRNSDNSVERLYPAPADLSYKPEEDGTPATYAIRRPADNADFATTPPFDGWRPLVSDTNVEGLKEAGGWLTQAQFKVYAEGDPANITGDRVSSLYDVEERVGLGVNKRRRTAESGLLYHARFVRVHDGVGLLVGVNMNVFDNSGLLNIGGESRSGHYAQVEFTPKPNAKSGRVKLVLLTPAYFTGGWQPADANWSPWVGGGRLVSFAAPRPLEISGWDMARRQAKPLRRYLTAGSVFYFEDAELTGTAFTETPPEEPDFGAMGYGAYAALAW